MTLIALFDPESVVRQIERERVTCIRGVPTMPVGLLEVCVRGCRMMLGYHGDAAATAAAIGVQGRLHTSDLGTMDERGYVRVTGRVKDMIIRGGDDAPLDIEDLHRHCWACLSPQRTPTVWCGVDELPLTGSRKIQKFRLREWCLAGEPEVELHPVTTRPRIDPTMRRRAGNRRPDR